MERVGCGSDHPPAADQTGSLRVTTTLILRDERADRLSVARIFTANRVTGAKSGCPGT